MLVIHASLLFGSSDPDPGVGGGVCALRNSGTQAKGHSEDPVAGLRLQEGGLGSRWSLLVHVIFLLWSHVKLSHQNGTNVVSWGDLNGLYKQEPHTVYLPRVLTPYGQLQQPTSVTRFQKIPEHPASLPRHPHPPFQHTPGGTTGCLLSGNHMLWGAWVSLLGQGGVKRDIKGTQGDSVDFTPPGSHCSGHFPLLPFLWSSAPVCAQG